MRAGLENKAGGRGGAQPPPRGGLGGADLQTYSLLAKQKLRKKGCAVLVVVINITVQ